MATPPSSQHDLPSPTRWRRALEFIGHADDRLRVLFTHEYTHIVHLIDCAMATLASRHLGRALCIPEPHAAAVATEGSRPGKRCRPGLTRLPGFRAVETIVGSCQASVDA